MKLNLANKLTLLRVFLIPVFLVLLLGGFLSETASNYSAAAIFILAALTDTLDGYIARSRNMITDLGKFMDPLADKLLVCSALIAFVELDRLAAWIVIVIISREFIVTGFRAIAAGKNLVLAAGFSGKLKTVCQMLMTVALLLNFNNEIFGIVCNILIAASVVLTIYSACEYIVKNINVLRG